MKKILFTMVFVLAAGLLAYGAQKSKIELTDGSTLEGEVVSLSKGQYTVKSPSLGSLKIAASKVRAIRSAEPVEVSAEKGIASLDKTTAQNEMQKVQAAVTGNPEVLAAIPGLLSNPDFQDLLKDPEVVNAAKSMDLKTLMANEKFVKAANSQAVKDISKKVQEKKA